MKFFEKYLFNRAQYQNDNYTEDSDNYDESESLSVEDAAEIWRSNGCDEDYTFGYTEEELEKALR